MYLVLYGIIGLAVGSFLNLVIDRAPARASLLGPPSHCPWCGRRLTALELVPLFSYLALRGRCRTCGAHIPGRTLWVESATALLFGVLWWLYGPVPQLAFVTVYSCILLVIMVIDLEHKLVLNVIVLPATLFALVVMPLQWALSDPPFTHYAFLWLFFPGLTQNLSPALLAMISQVVGGVVAFGIFLVIWLIAPRGMGAGDVKLAAFAGLITAFPGAIAAVCGSFVLGGLVGIALLASGTAGRKTAIPFAPFLVITTLAMLLFGDNILRWYLHTLVG